MADQYFAQLPPEELLPELWKRIDDFRKYIQDYGWLQLWRRSEQAYTRACYTGGKLKPAGDQGELTRITVNHYRNIAQHMLVLATNQKPQWEPQSVNTDAKSLAQTIVAKGELEYQMRDKRVDRNNRQQTEDQIKFGEGWLVGEWDEDAGSEYGADPASQQVVKEGDIGFYNVTPDDMVRDVRTRGGEFPWLIPTKYVSRWDLIAKYPDLRDQILAVPSFDKSNDTDITWLFGQQQADGQQNDIIPLYEFRHARTAAVPRGRLVQFLHGNVLLRDVDLPYERLGVHRMADSRLTKGAFAYTPMFDLLPLQEAVDGMYSTILSNQRAFGVQSVLVPIGSSISESQLNSGMQVLFYDPKLGEPKPLALTLTKPEIFTFLEKLERLFETLSGVNAVARGDPQSSLKSGAALALVASQAIQFASGLDEARAMALEDEGMFIVTTMRDFVKNDRVAKIVGKTKQAMLAYFTGDDFRDINRVTVTLGNPLMRTIAGKIQVADALLERGLIKTAQQYFQVLDAGRLDAMYEGEQQELVLIQDEKQELLAGRSVPVMFTDDHVLHIREEKSVGASVAARRDPNVMAVLTEHLQAHVEALKQLSMMQPELLQLLGQPLLAQAMPPPPGPQGQGGPPQPGQPADAMQEGIPVEQTGNAVGLPQMPTNPMSGQQFNHTDGGLAA